MIKTGSVVRYVREQSSTSTEKIGLKTGDLVLITNEKNSFSGGKIHFQFKNLRTGQEHDQNSSSGLILTRDGLAGENGRRVFKEL